MNGTSARPHSRLSEAGGILYLLFGLGLWLSLLSYHPEDPSFNTAAGAVRCRNLIGPEDGSGFDPGVAPLGDLLEDPREVPTRPIAVNDDLEADLRLDHELVPPMP